MYGTVQSPPLQVDSLDPPDTPYAMAVGLYAALLVSPALVGGATAVTTLGAAGLYVTFLAAVTAVTVALTWLVGRWRGFPERTGGSAVSWLFPLLGVLAAGTYFAAAVSHVAFPSGIALFGFMTSAAAVALGFALRAMSRSRYTAAVVDEESVECEWEAGWPERPRVAAAVAGFALMIGGMAAFLGEFLPGGDAVEYLGFAGYLIGTGLISVGRRWTYRVTPVGLERRLPVVRTIDRWDDLDGFEERESVLVIHRAAPWRPAIRCSWDEIDDRGAVIDALRRHVARR